VAVGSPIIRQPVVILATPVVKRETGRRGRRGGSGAEARLRLQIIRHAQLMTVKGYVVGADGNISARHGDCVLITPSRVDYYRLKPDRIVAVDLEGRGGENPSSELHVHLAIYRARPDVLAIVHAHPVHACVLAVRRELLPPVLEEAGSVLGGPVGVADPAPSGSAELGGAAALALGDRHAVLLAGHGSVTTGPNLEEAFYRLEVLERTAHVYVLSRLLGPGA
jgi:L-fuculose-phosphate aldolase